MQSTEIIGYIAATATTLSFIPQAVKIISTRDTRSISLWMYLIFSFGLTFWLVYGVLKEAVPIILANVVTLLFNLIIIFYKLTEKRSAAK
jgi:MtN3 and saliva related transmembrane protein